MHSQLSAPKEPGQHERAPGIVPESSSSGETRCSLTVAAHRVSGDFAIGGTSLWLVFLVEMSHAESSTERHADSDGQSYLKRQKDNFVSQLHNSHVLPELVRPKITLFIQHSRDLFAPGSGDGGTSIQD